MRFLILHGVQDVLSVRRTTFNQSFCLPRYAPEHDYVLQCYGRPIPSKLAEYPFDVIVLDTTFLCYRWARPRTILDNLRRDYDFVRRSPAVKVAFPQDDYDHHVVLDEWLSDWGVNIVFSPLARFREVLYPRTGKCAEILECLTGHAEPADDAMLEAWRKPFAERPIDVGFRARDLPKYFGRLGRQKAEIGERFIRALGPRSGLRMDISNRLEDTLLGTRWLEFLGNSKFTLGSISGSSLLDPDGDIQDCARAYEEVHPGSTFEEVEANCFPGQDGAQEFSALGPRNVEAAMARSCQILVASAHWAPLEPGKHFIALDPDCRNAREVLAQMSDVREVHSRIEACYELLIGEGTYSYASFVDRILAAIDRAVGTSEERDRRSSLRDHRPTRPWCLIAELRILRELFAGEATDREAVVRREIEHLMEELGRRTGRRGAIRELFGANEYLGPGGSRVVRAEALPAAARVFFIARSALHVTRRIASKVRAASRRAGRAAEGKDSVEYNDNARS
jgi:hypothetical protein